MKTQIKAVRLEKKVVDSLSDIMKKKKYNFSEVVSEALVNYIEEERFAGAVDNAYGSWKEKDHPELKSGTGSYIRKIRKGRKI